MTKLHIGHVVFCCVEHPDCGERAIGDERVELLRRLYRGQAIGEWVAIRDPWLGLKGGKAVVTKGDVDWTTAGKRVTE